MKDINGKIQYKGKEYAAVFNLNVMEQIQDKYGTLDAWGKLTDGTSSGEPDAKAVIFGFTAMINEGIEIENDENGTDIKPLTTRQVGRIISDVGLHDATAVLNDTVIKSTEGESKNE